MCDRVQRHRSNVAIAWRWKSNNFSAPAEYQNASTPLMVDGTLYFGAGSERWVIAADAGTGATKWTWHLDEGERGRRAPRRDSGRGVAYWTNGQDARIFTVTPGFQLVALDARTGLPVDSFGARGIVDLKANLGVPADPVTAAIGNSSPPLVFENIVVIGPALEVEPGADDNEHGQPDAGAGGEQGHGLVGSLELDADRITLRGDLRAAGRLGLCRRRADEDLARR